MPRVSQWISERIENLMERAQGQEELFHFDILIVGSGYGGALAASTFGGCHHDGRALRIGVLERGDEYLSGMFPKNLAELPAHLRGMAGANRFGQSHGLFDLRLNGDINVLTGNGVGGGSLINAGVMAAPLADVFDQRWPRALQQGAALDFTRARALVGAANLDNPTLANTASAGGQTTKKYQSLKSLAPTECSEAAITTAMAAGPNQVGMQLAACNHCGDCVTGCNHGAKNSLDLNLLAQAKQQGVEIYAGVSVGKIERDPQASDTWLLHTHLTHDKLREGQPEAMLLRANKVILAAGSLGSTEILMRSASEQLTFSEQLGQGFSGNGDAIAVGFKQKLLAQAIAWPEIKPSDRKIGPTITGIIDFRQSAGLLIEEMAVPSALAQFFSDLYTCSESLHAFSEFNWEAHTSGPVVDDPFSLNRHSLNHTSLYAIMGDDGADGQLELKSPKDRLFAEGELQVHWPSARDKPLFNQQVSALKTLAQNSVQGRVLANPAWAPLPPEMTALYGAQKGPLLTVHPLGGCAMADSIERGVVDDLGQVFNGDDVGGIHAGLVVLDGAIMPSALGINPALTISAVALRACEALRAQWQYEQNRIASVAIEPAFTQRPIWRETNTQEDITATKISVNERLSGEINLLTKTGEIRVVAELTLKFKDKALTDFFQTEGNGSTQNRISEVIFDAHNRELHSYLRLYKPEDWQSLTQSRAEPSAFENAALLTAPISGQLEVMQRQPISVGQRYWQGLKAWLPNRGIRDILQNVRTAGRPTSSMRKRDKALNLLKILGYAGEVRLFDYALLVHKPRDGWPADFLGFLNDRDNYPISGRKSIGYRRRANPIRQVSDITLTEFPGLIAEKKANILSFDNRNIARNNQPLISIAQHQNLVQAFADLCSFYAYFARLLLSTHLLTFRLPDAPDRRRPQRFAGQLKSLPKPEIIELKVATLANGLPIHIRLTRYKNESRSEPPLIMLHGYSASSTTWAHPAIDNCAALYFHQQDRDIWLVDLRTSCGFLTAMLPWRFEDVAFQDIPLALHHILQLTKHDQCDVIAHCMGAAMLSMAILKTPEAGAPYFKERKQLPSIIRNLVLTQVGPKVSFSPMNMTRGYLLKNLRHLMGNLPFSFRPSDAPSALESLLDRALQILPYPEPEYDRENPAYSGKFVTWSATRRRIDALYGQAFSLSNISDRLLAHIDDIFGPLSMGTLSQTIHFSLQEQITNFDGENVYATPENFRKRWHCNTLSLHGAQSGLADQGTATLMAQIMAHAPGAYQHHIFPNFGHQDLLIGKGCAEVFDHIQRFFSASNNSNATAEHALPAPNSPAHYSLDLPALGPVVGPAIAENLPIMLGCALSATRPDWVLFVALDQAGNAVQTLDHAIHSTAASDFFHLQSTRSMRHQWLKLSLKGRALSHSAGRWQCFFIYDHYRATENLPLSAALPNNLMDLLHIAGSPHQQITAKHLSQLLSDDAFLSAYKQAMSQPNRIRKAGQIEWRPTRPEKFSFLVAACQFPAILTDQQPAFASYRRVAQRLDQDNPPQLMLLLGDQVYVDPTAGALDAQAYHHRNVEPYQTWLAQPEVGEVLRRLPTYMMPDDHEIANDWDLNIGQNRKFVYAMPGRESYLRFQRHSAFQPKPWHFSKSRQPFSALPLWQVAEHGGVHFFFADARTERLGRSAHNLNTEIMNAEQYLALTKWLTSAPVDAPKVISTGSMLLPRRLRSTTGAGAAALSDAWDGYSKQLIKLLAFIGEEKIANLVFISGDEHISCHAHIEIKHAKGSHIIHSIHSSGLYSPLPFVNSKAEDFAEQDRLVLNDNTPALSAEIHATFFPGDGFAELQFEKINDKWYLHCHFNRQTGGASLRLNFHQGAIEPIKQGAPLPI